MLMQNNDSERTTMLSSAVTASSEAGAKSDVGMENGCLDSLTSEMGNGGVEGEGNGAEAMDVDAGEGEQVRQQFGEAKIKFSLKGAAPGKCQP